MHCDLGIATQNLLLGAAEQGVFGCRIGAFAPAVVHRLLQLEERCKVLLVVALGYPAETVVLEGVRPGRRYPLLARRRGRAPCAQTRAGGDYP